MFCSCVFNGVRVFVFVCVGLFVCIFPCLLLMFMWCSFVVCLCFALFWFCMFVLFCFVLPMAYVVFWAVAVCCGCRCDVCFVRVGCRLCVCVCGCLFVL